MKDLTHEVIARAIVDYINSNLPTIRESVLAGTRDDMTENEFYTQTILNSIRVSTELSVTIILKVLENAGLIHLLSDEKELRKLLLHPVGKSEQD